MHHLGYEMELWYGSGATPRCGPTGTGRRQTARQNFDCVVIIQRISTDTSTTACFVLFLHWWQVIWNLFLSRNSPEERVTLSLSSTVISLLLKYTENDPKRGDKALHRRCTNTGWGGRICNLLWAVKEGFNQLLPHSSWSQSFCLISMGESTTSLFITENMLQRINVVQVIISRMRAHYKEFNCSDTC